MNRLNESRLYLSPSLRTYLKKNISDEIVKELLDFEGKESGKDITLIDVDGDNFSYSSAKVIDKDYKNKMTLLSDEQGEKVDIKKKFFSNEINNILDSKNRSTIRIGKLINSLFPNKFNDSQVEKFVNIIRSKNTNNYEFKIVSGDDIKKYYSSESCADYSEESNTGWYSIGTLGSSCMMDKGEYSPKIFDIYTKNPDTCRMLVMLNKGELVARALLWKVHCFNLETSDEFDGQYLDRIYFQYPWMVNSMSEYANENGFIMKYYNSGISHNDHKAILNGKEVFLKMTVNVKKIFYSSFPYIDTFKHFDVKNGILANYDVKGFVLGDIGGDYSSSGGVGNRMRNFVRRFK